VVSLCDPIGTVSLVQAPSSRNPFSNANATGSRVCARYPSEGSILNNPPDTSHLTYLSGAPWLLTLFCISVFFRIIFHPEFLFGVEHSGYSITPYNLLSAFPPKSGSGLFPSPFVFKSPFMEFLLYVFLIL